ncbi:MAG: GNAT family N-acetyltransferase [Candidatus Eisenbacteria bacterium]
MAREAETRAGRREGGAGDGAVEIQWLDDLPSLLRFGREWDSHLDAWDCRLPFLRWDWIRSWTVAYARRSPHPTAYRVAVGRLGGRVIGIAPLVLSRRRLMPLGPRIRVLHMIGDGPLCPDHLTLPCEPGMEKRFAAALHAALHARRGRWDRIELRDLLRPEDAGDRPGSTGSTDSTGSTGATGAAPALLESVRGTGATVLDRVRTQCPYAELPPTWDEFLARLSRKMRSNVKLGWRKLEDSFSVDCAGAATIEEVDRAMEVLERLHTRAWRERDRIGVFDDPRFRLFHRLHARRAFRSGTLRLLALTCDEKPVAAILCFAGGRTIHYYQLGHDPDLRAYGVGTLMVLAAIRRAIEEGAVEFDFLRGSDPYKSRLAPRERRGWDIVFHSDSFADRTGMVVAWTRRRAGRVARGVLGKRGTVWVKSRLRMR